MVSGQVLQAVGCLPGQQAATRTCEDYSSKAVVQACACAFWLVLLHAGRLQMDLYGQNDKAKAQAAYQAG